MGIGLLIMLLLMSPVNACYVEYGNPMFNDQEHTILITYNSTNNYEQYWLAKVTYELQQKNAAKLQQQTNERQDDFQDK